MDLRDFSDKAAVVGVGYTEKQGTVPGRSNISFAQEAARAAIEDAGLKKSDIDGLLIQPTMGMQSYSVAAKLGLSDLRLLANEDEDGGPSFKALSAKAKEDLIEAMAPHGIKVLSASAGNIEVGDDEVRKQWVGSWKANWEMRKLPIPQL